MRRYERRANASGRPAATAENPGSWPKDFKDFEDWGRAEWKEFKAWSRQQDWKSGAKDIEAAARDFQRKLHETFDRETSKFTGNPQAAASVAPEAPRESGARPSEDPKFKTDDERRAYELARKQASREAGFYIHLMWYGIVIGFLFLLNMFTSPFNWWWHVAGLRMGLRHREPCRRGVRMGCHSPARLRTRHPARGARRGHQGKRGDGEPRSRPRSTN